MPHDFHWNCVSVNVTSRKLWDTSDITQRKYFLFMLQVSTVVSGQASHFSLVFTYRYCYVEPTDLQYPGILGVIGSYRTQTWKCLPFVRLLPSQNLMLQLYPQSSVWRREKIQVLKHNVASASDIAIQNNYTVFLNVNQYKFIIYPETRKKGIASGNLGINALTLSQNTDYNMWVNF